jgi:hypothetical protein
MFQACEASTGNVENTVPSPKRSYTEAPPSTLSINRQIFRDSFVVDNRVRTPLSPIPLPYQQQQHAAQQQRPTNTCSSLFGHARMTASLEEAVQQQQLHRWRYSIHDEEAPIDSDTLLPITKGNEQSLVGSVTAPHSHGRLPNYQSPNVRLRQQADLTSAIATSPDSAYETFEDRHDDDDYNFNDHIRSKSPISGLFGEDISVTAAHASTMQEESSEGRYSYSPNSTEVHDVERPVDPTTRIARSPGEVLKALPVIGGPSSDTKRSSRPSIRSSRVQVSNLIQQAGEWTRNEIVPVARTAGRKAQLLVHQYLPPLSPRSKNMASLKYLRDAHKSKVNGLSNVEHEDHFDFALVLAPQEVYSYWADLLDFRVEHLGEDATHVMNAVTSSWTTSSDDDEDGSPINSVDTRSSASLNRSPQRATDEQQAKNDFSTPSTGMYQRRGKRLSSADSVTPEPTTMRSTSSRGRILPLPPPYQTLNSSRKPLVPRLSVFERALGPAVFTPSRGQSVEANGFGQNEDFKNNASAMLDATPNTAVSINRRRWGPHSLNGTLLTPNCMMSPPIRSLCHGGSSSVLTKRLTTHSRTTGNFSVREEAGEEDSECTPGGSQRQVLKSIKIEDIPSHVIPRGIAARTNGMLQFLSALKRGIVVRRHRSGMEPIFCKIVSNDGGDTIRYDHFFCN